MDEALLRDTPPDSNLRPTVGLALLLGSSPGNLTTQDSVTGSNIAPVNDPQLERISLNQTHPHTDTCTHTHTHNRARMGPRAHEP